MSFGFGSPYMKKIQRVTVMQKFPDGSVYQVMPPTSVEEEILKGTTNADISSAHPNKDTLPPNLTQEGKGDYFEVQNYDFSIEEGKENNLDSIEDENIESDSANGADIDNDNIPDDHENSNKGDQSESSNDNGESQNEEKCQSHPDEEQLSGILEFPEVENGNQDLERVEIENWFKIIE